LISIKNKARFGTVATVILLTQITFPFYVLLLNFSGNNCAGEKPPSAKKHCCAMCDTGDSHCCCSAKLPANTDTSHSVSQCECVHKILSSNTEITDHKSFELDKDLSVQNISFCDCVGMTGSRVQRVFCFGRINGPPIYLSSSSFLI
jgi:hypothetical protein